MFATTHSSFRGAWRACCCEFLFRPRVALPFAIVGFGVLLSLSCTHKDSVPVPGPTITDSTPPLLRLGSAGLQNNFELTQDSTEPQSRRVKSTDDVVLLAVATDSETGVRRVSLSGEIRVACISRAGYDLPIVDPIDETEVIPPDQSTLPVTLAKQYRVQVSAQMARCPSHKRFHSLRVRVKAQAENGLKKIRNLQTAVINSFILRVGTFNLSRPANPSDDQYVSFGTVFGSIADVLLLTEVEDLRRAQLIASAAGMNHVVALRDKDSDLAIVSRTPLRNIERRTISPPSAYPSGNSNILSAMSDIDGAPHQLVVTHWGIRDAGNVEVYPWTASPFHLAAATTILGLLSPAPQISIVGGDLNAFSGVGPQDPDSDPSTPDIAGGVPAIDLLRVNLTDTFSALLPNATHCSNQRIDYVFIRGGGYVPSAYEACYSNPFPSDHPYVLVTLE